MSYQNNERLRQLGYTNLYVIRNMDTGETMQYASLDKPITIGGSIPSFWNTGAFVPSTMEHSQIKLDTQAQQPTVSVQAEVDLNQWAQFFVAPASNPWKIDIYRCNNLVSPDFTADVEYVYSGDLADYSFAGIILTANFTPQSLSMNRPIPRVFYQRGCNWELYGPGCGVNPASYQHAATVLGWNRYESLLNVSIPDGVNPDYLVSGYILDIDTQTKVSIIDSEPDGAGNYNLYLLQWLLELEEVGNEMTIFEGCAHNVSACARFSNVPNFGGFPTIPTTNPSIDGV